MKKIAQKITQVLTGISAGLCLCVGKAMAAESELTPAQQGASWGRGDGMPAELVGDNGIFARFTNLALLAVGLVSVIMLIYGGVRYILSGGDAKKVTDAKNTILYAIIGLIISLLAYAIVNFILTSVIGVTDGAV